MADEHTITIQASRRERDLIDRTAQALSKSRSDFVLETASREAEHVLLDRTHFQLDNEAFSRFEDLLDNPPTPSQGLRDLLLCKTPW